MILEKINLYDYFKKDKCGGKGILTIYAHENSNEISKNRLYPAMLVIHGGGYQGESFRESEPISLAFYNKGFNCFELQYDLSPFSYEFSPLIEGAMAMKYIRNNTSKYLLNNKVCSVGFSAGGHLVSFLATAFDDPIYKDFFNGDIEGIRPDGVILSYAVISKDYPSKAQTLMRLANNNEDLLDKISTEKRVNKNSSPAYIWTTSDDECVNCINSIKIAEKYAENGVPFSLHIYPKGQHGLSLANNSVYKKGTDFRHSNGIENWIEEASNFLKENNIDIED